MSKCSACEELRNDAPNFVLNGVTKEACTSLKNDTGFNPNLTPLNDNCTDLDNANECLVGNMADQIEAYDVCDWKDYMRKFVPNVYTVLKAMICGECGIWTNIHNLWTKVNLALCQISFLMQGKDFTFGEERFEMGSGVTSEGGQIREAPLQLIVRGNCWRVHGSLKFTGSQWLGLGLTNTGGTKGKINTDEGNWRIAILKIKKSEVPEIATWYNGTGTFVNAGVGTIHIRFVNGDSSTNKYYPNQWGWTTTDLTDNTAPEGYVYCIIELESLVTWGITGGEYAACTIDANGLVKLNGKQIDCDD